METTNDERADWGRMALDIFTTLTFGGRKFEELCDDDQECAFGDLICALAHFADRNNLRLDKALLSAEGHYLAECEGDFAAERDMPNGPLQRFFKARPGLVRPKKYREHWRNDDRLRVFFPDGEETLDGYTATDVVLWGLPFTAEDRDGSDVVIDVITFEHITDDGYEVGDTLKGHVDSLGFGEIIRDELQRMVDEAQED